MEPVHSFWLKAVSMPWHNSELNTHNSELISRAVALRNTSVGVLTAIGVALPGAAQ